MPEAKHPHLSKAPIAEAVIEIKAALAKPVADAAFDNLQARLADRYPVHQMLRRVQAMLSIEGDALTLPEATPMSRLGVRLTSSDEKDVVIATSASLVVSRLEPYESWTDLVAATRMLWPIYCEVVECTEVKRLGVRCINRIELPTAESLDLDSVFTAGPNVPPELSQTVEQYTTRVVLPYPDRNAMLAIVQALEPQPVLPNMALLDVDAFSLVTMKPDDEAMWQQLDVLHDLRNDGFFGSLQKSIWEKYL